MDAKQANEEAFTLLKKGRVEEAHALIEENFRAYPNYLPGRINYADLLVQKKRLDEIPELFKGVTPSSANERRGIAVVMSHYFLLKGKRSEAEREYVEAVKADPLHPSVAILEKKLFEFRWLKRVLSFMINRS